MNCFSDDRSLELATAAYIRSHGYTKEADLIESLVREMRITEDLVTMYKRVLDSVPECPAHGACVPHAIKWIESRK